jgi:allantoinase
MSDWDVLFRGGTLITPETVRVANVAVVDGKIARIAESIEGTADEVVQADSLFLFPGFIDAHVHFNEPGRAHWEGINTGSRALAAGGGTTFLDMPLNASPPTLNRESFRQKKLEAEQKSVLDFGLWGGLTPINLDSLEELGDAGVVGFKAFMSRSGTDDFPRADLSVLKRGMKIAAARGLLVGVHAEDDELTQRIAAESQNVGKISWRDYLSSRPIEAELIAIRQVLDLAGETGCALHIVHVSSPEGIDLISKAKRQGINVTAEICSHHLLLTDQDMETTGAAAKCAPPLRDANRAQILWERFATGAIDTLGSDHSPSPLDMKLSDDFFKIWGGIAGCQHAFPLALSDWYRRTGENGLPRFSAAAADSVARRFRLANKGRIELGFDADLVLVDLNASERITPEKLLYRHKISPYIGHTNRAVISQTWVRGKIVYRDGKIAAHPGSAQMVTFNV